MAASGRAVEWSPSSAAVQNATELAALEAQAALDKLERFRRELDEAKHRLDAESHTRTKLEGENRKLIESSIAAAEILARLDVDGALSQLRVSGNEGVTTALPSLASLAARSNGELHESLTRARAALREAKAEAHVRRQKDLEKIARLEEQLQWATKELDDLRRSFAAHAPHYTPTVPPSVPAAVATTVPAVDTVALGGLRLAIEEHSRALRALRDGGCARADESLRCCCVHHTSAIDTVATHAKARCKHEVSPARPSPGHRPRSGGLEDKLQELRRELAGPRAHTLKEADLLELLEQGERLFAAWQRSTRPMRPRVS